jgi:RNA polymerase sigma-70 factor (ECF subfamily)
MADTDERPDPLRDLMGAAQRGDAAAYVALLRAVTPTIRAIVHKQRGFAGIPDVEDLVQDVLLSLHAVRASYDPSRPFMPWLLAIVRNRLADGARRYARIARRETRVTEDDVTFGSVEANVNIAELGDAAAVRAAVRALPDGQRQAIELLKLEELSLAEAAERTGTSVGALKVATHRAMASLRRAFGTKGS